MPNFLINTSLKPNNETIKSALDLDVKDFTKDSEDLLDDYFYFESKFPNFLHNKSNSPSDNESNCIIISLIYSKDNIIL